MKKIYLTPVTTKTQVGLSHIIAASIGLINEEVDEVWVREEKEGWNNPFGLNDW